MKICQTLCSNYKNLLTDSFGWYSPQHHLIAWAYSCLKLREFYPNVQLYTDSESAKILIDKINIPYTDYHIEYDQWRYNHFLWAYPKLLTYNKQKESFIHVDGDVFIEKSFDDSLINARLIAQNEELSTDFYKELFAPILKKIIYIPEFLKENLLAEYPKSFNAGVIGGNDVDLLQRYSQEAIQFVEENYPCHPEGNFSMIFEQVLFYSFTEETQVKPACIYEKTYNDNGYIMDDFGDFSTLKYMHLIGPLKKNKYICDQLTRRLYIEYPSYFEKVVSLFPSTHKNISFFIQKETNVQIREKSVYNKTRALIQDLYPDNNLKDTDNVDSFVNSQNNSILNKVYEYEKEFNEILSNKFSQIDIKDIEHLENNIFASNTYLSSLQGKLYLNPYIEFIETPFNVLNFNPFEVLSERKTTQMVACVPQLFFDGFKEINLDDLSVNMLAILDEETGPITYSQLKDKASDLFERVENDEDAIDSLLQRNLKFLIGNNLIYIQSSAG